MRCFVAACRPARHRAPDAFALVLTLVLLSLVAIVAVSYLSSMATERATANAFGNKTRAEQAAQAGVDSAEAILRDAFRAFPDSATAWDTAQSANADGSTNEGTTLYLRAVAKDSGVDAVPDPAPGIADASAGNADFAGGNGPNNVDATTGADRRKIFALPLVSGATPKRLERKSAALPTPGAGSFVNLNGRRQINDTQGWLGTPPGYANPARPRPVYVPWVEMRQQDGLRDPAQAPVVGRYAYWVEDESFRANINAARLGENHQRADNAGNVPLDARNVDLLGLLDTLVDTDAGTLAQSLFDTRTIYPGQIFPEARAFEHTPGLSAEAVNRLRFLSTTQSAALNLSRHGTQRLNLNAAVPPGTAPDAYDAIQTQVDEIVATIQFHAPNFGQRFYRKAPASGSITDAAVLDAMTVSRTAAKNYAKIYDYKIAANLRDYLDADCVPTCILNTGQVRRSGRPLLPLNVTDNTSAGENATVSNPVWALGKDAAPFVQECAVRYGPAISASHYVAPARYTLTADYYVEFWNMSTRTVSGSDLGPHPFIRVTDPTRWQCNNSAEIPATSTTPKVKAFGSAVDLPRCDTPDYCHVSPSEDGTTGTRDFDIDLSGANVIFPAGAVTVITTDPDYLSIIQDAEALKHVVLCPFVLPGTRSYSGPMPTGRPAAGKDVLDMEFRSSSSSDFETGIVVGSDYGVIDALKGALPLSWGGRISIPHTGDSTILPGVFGGYLRGNWTNTVNQLAEGMQASEVGDPRTNNEQLVYTLDPNSGSVDHTRFETYDVMGVASPTVDNPGTGVVQTLGLPNYRSVRPNRPENPWPDLPPCYADPNAPTAAELVLSAANAPVVVANGALTSVGQLGDVFDPARTVEDGTVGGSRGGGRSLKIGQHDDRWDGDENSSSRSWCSWRLTDFFCTTDAVQQPGLININGVTRDGGAALRAALTGFRFQPAPLGDARLGDAGASGLKVDALIKEMEDRLRLPMLDPDTGAANTGTSQTGAGPFWERGELSELPGFGRSPDQIKPDRTLGPTRFPTTDLTGVDLSSQTLDRGREELFRRLVEMTTTRGSVFTVYALGQAIQQARPNDPASERVVATQQLKVTFRLVPKNKAGADGTATDFQPGGTSGNRPADFGSDKAAATQARFSKPDHYDVQVLSAGSGNG